MGAIPVVKAALEKLLDRNKKAQDKLTTLLDKTKDQREACRANGYVTEGKSKVDQVEAAMSKVDAAELPFLKGIETLPLKETQDTIVSSEAVSEEAAKAISDARTFIAAKNLECKRFSQESVSKPATEEFTKLTDRVNAAAAKLSQFRKDTEGRKKAAQMQECMEKVSA